MTIALDQLCDGLPKELQEMLAYVRGLHFNSDPNYDYLEGRLKLIAEHEGFNLEVRDFDWIQVVKKKIA